MTTVETHKLTFTEHLPELRHMAGAAFRHLDPEAKEEAVQNSIALTWKAWQALIEQGRADDLSLMKSCLCFSIRQTRAGRRAQGRVKSGDVYELAKHGRVRFENELLDCFISDETSVPMQVSFRVDVPAFLTMLNDRQRRMAEALMAGWSTGEVAAMIGVSAAAISQFRQRFKALYDQFMAV